MRQSFQAILCAGLLCLVTGCSELAKNGVNTVSVKCGVSVSGSMFWGRCVSEVVLENPDDKQTHANARVELEVLLHDGDVVKKVFHVGTLKPGERWSHTLPSPLRNVSSIVFLYSCDHGATQGILSVAPESHAG